jgi:hypothetical protein
MEGKMRDRGKGSYERYQNFKKGRNFVVQSCVSSAIDTGESEIGVIDTRESKPCSVVNTAINTTESMKIPLNHFSKLIQVFIFFIKKVIKPNLSQDELYYPKPFRQRLNKWGLPQENLLTQRYTDIVESNSNLNILANLKSYPKTL